MAKQSDFSRIADQMSALTDLMYGAGADAFSLLSDKAQAKVRILFAALNDELQGEVAKHA